MMPSVKKESYSKVEGLSKREEKKKINIHWNSGLFFQIGLIISMLLVFLIVESNIGFGENDFKIPERTELNEIALNNYVVEVQQEQKVEVKKEAVIEREPVKQVISSKFTPIDNTSLKNESDVAKTEVDSGVDLLKPNINNRTVPKKVTKQYAVTVQNAPIFPGCESLLTNDERKACFNSKINAFIARKFNIEKFSDKYAGTKPRIDVQFTVDSKGEIIDIKTAKVYEDLSIEAKRVISSLPKMTPGSHDQQLVDVIYMVPITLNIDY